MTDVTKTLPEKSEDVQFDAYAKQLTSHRWVLAQILRHVLPELENRSVSEVMDMIGPDISSGVPLAPGQTNRVQKTDTGERITGLNTEDSATNEGSIYFDLLFGMQLGDLGEQAEVQVIVDIEPMRQLSASYELSDREQVYAARGIGSQVGRNIQHQRYSDAQPYIGIWLCFNREANTFHYTTYRTESASYSRDQDGRLVRDKALEMKRSLSHIYTIGFTNEGPAEDVEERRELFTLLTALYSATIGKERKVQILRDEFGLAEAPDRIAIEEEVNGMSTLAAVIERDLRKRFADEREEAQARIQQITAERDNARAERDNARVERDDMRAERDSALQEAAALRKLLAEQSS